MVDEGVPEHQHEHMVDGTAHALAIDLLVHPIFRSIAYLEFPVLMSVPYIIWIMHSTPMCRHFADGLDLTDP